MADKLFEMFCNGVLDIITSSYNCKAYLDVIDKNNGQKYTGLVIQDGNNNLAPVFCLDFLYKEFVTNEKTVSDIAKTIHDDYQNIKSRHEYSEMQNIDLSDWRDRVFMVVVNHDMNEDMLRDCPHIDFFDLSIVFRYFVSANSKGFSSFVIHNDTLVDCSLNELFEAAGKNTFKIFEPKCIELAELFRTKFGVYDDNMVTGNFTYVVTNKYELFGSNCIVNLDYLKELSELYANGGDFYIIPSSVHELLIITDFVNDPKFAAHALNTISEVNKTAVKDGDILSYNLYKYNSDIGGISIVRNEQ